MMQYPASCKDCTNLEQRPENEYLLSLEQKKNNQTNNSNVSFVNSDTLEIKQISDWYISYINNCSKRNWGPM